MVFNSPCLIHKKELIHHEGTALTEGPLQSSSVSSDFTSKLLNLDDPSPDINSLMNTSTVPPPPPLVNPSSRLTTIPQQQTPDSTTTTNPMIFGVDAAMELKEKHQVFTAAREELSTARHNLMLLNTAAR
nr:hypothetical protein [Tanacetum cinerariifolium]